NEAFLNSTLPFEQFIFINYEDDSGGEGVATKNNNNNNFYNTHCSAGFSANSLFIYRVPFGVIKSWSFIGADYALIEKINDEYKSNPFLRNSLFSDEIPYVYIDLFNLNGNQVPAGYEVCISGYDSHVKYGSVTSSDSLQALILLRPGL
ncbi:23779_t:CDS:2, partial [Gigaspora margarita]